MDRWTGRTRAGPSAQFGTVHGMENWGRGQLQTDCQDREVSMDGDRRQASRVLPTSPLELFICHTAPPHKQVQLENTPRTW